MELDKESVETWLNAIREFLKTFHWMGNSFVLDHFTDSHWEALPESWRNFLSMLGPAQLSEWIVTGKYSFPLTGSPIGAVRGSIGVTGIPTSTQAVHPAPLSLQALRISVETLSLNRDCNNPNVCLAKTETKSSIDVDHKRNQSKTGDNSPSNVDSRSAIIIEDKLLKLLNRHVKPKKQHEISHLSKLIQELSHQSGDLKNLIDIGSGLGHLCRFLSYGLGFNTVGIDSDSKLGLNAKLFNEEIDRHLQKSEKNLKVQNKIVPNDCSDQRCDDDDKSVSGRDLLEAKCQSEHLNKYLEKDDKISMFEEFGLIGLHGCGDLGGIVVQNFVENPQAKFLAFASCCYMKLNDCFPLSSFLRANPIELKYESLELACHAKEIYMQRLNDPEQVNKLKTHCYRATLETILRKHGFVREGLKSVKNNHLMSFDEYALKATKNLQINLEDEELHSHNIEKMLSEWMQVVYFYTLRVLVAPVIETVVLLDRALLILEHGFKCELRPVFDPVKSPRNIVIIGIK